MLEHVEVFENRIVLTLIGQDVANAVEGVGRDKQEGSEASKSEQLLTKPRQIVIPCNLGHPRDENPCLQSPE